MIHKSSNGEKINQQNNACDWPAQNYLSCKYLILWIHKYISVVYNKGAEWTRVDFRRPFKILRKKVSAAIQSQSPAKISKFGNKHGFLNATRVFPMCSIEDIVFNIT